MSDEVNCLTVVALLLAGDVQARVVHGGSRVMPTEQDEKAWTGIEVRKPDGTRIVWSNTLGTWGWTEINRSTGKCTTGHSMISATASPEDVALAIATMYDVPGDGPSI